MSFSTSIGSSNSRWLRNGGRFLVGLVLVSLHLRQSSKIVWTTLNSPSRESNKVDNASSRYLEQQGIATMPAAATATAALASINQHNNHTTSKDDLVPQVMVENLQAKQKEQEEQEAKQKEQQKRAEEERKKKATIAAQTATVQPTSDPIPEPKQSPTISTKQLSDSSASLSSSSSPYAYCFLVGGADPGDPATYINYFYSAVVATKILREKGSKADVLVLYSNQRKVPGDQLPPPDHLRVLFYYGIRLYQIPQIGPDEQESFYRTQMDKFRILSLTQYRKIMYLDTDVMPLGNLDAIMELSDKGTLMENVVVRGTNVPTHGAHFVLSPGPGKVDEVQQVLSRRQKEAQNMSYPWFDPVQGWGHSFTPDDPWRSQYKQGLMWDYYGSLADQGLLLYYVKYLRQNVTFLVPDGKHENWGLAPGNETSNKVQLMGTIDEKQVQLFQNNNMQDRLRFSKPSRSKNVALPEKCIEHFSAKAKPWMAGPPPNFTVATAQETSLRSARDYWWWMLSQVDKELGLQLDFANWRSKRPPFGLSPMWKDIPNTTMRLSEPLRLVDISEGVAKFNWLDSSIIDKSQEKLADSPKTGQIRGLFEPSAEVNSQTPTDALLEQELGWEKPPPEWVKDLCPKVVAHFDEFPSFKHFPIVAGVPLPVGTSFYFANAVCTLSVVKQIAASVGAVLHLYAGAHLAAVLHGQPIPWDDDIDAIVPLWAIRPIIEKCGDGIQIHNTAHIRCVEANNAVKFYVDYDGMEFADKFPNRRFNFKAPFVDLFAYKVVTERNVRKILEVTPTGGNQRFRYLPSSFFPSQPYYFAGTYVMGPKPEIATSRYSASRCTMGTFNHNVMRQIGGVVGKLNSTNLDLDCKRMSETFPFVYDDNTIRNGNSSIPIFPPKASIFNVSAEVSVDERFEWSKQPPRAGQDLTDRLPALNEVEVDNTICPQDTCGMDGALKVLEYNAGRGTFWLEAADLLEGADVILLNEMDIGMARSGQQHTTRLLAHKLGMNYAWGLEFMELTNGDVEETNKTKGLFNLYGLHGNAILSRCKILDPVVFRDKVGPYFADAKNWANAGGFEKRLGGRMGLYARIQVATETVVVGSTHKLVSHTDEIKSYIGSSKAVSAGDQDAQFCNKTGLVAVGNPSQRTWPASCTGFGRTRGDNICSNLGVVPESDKAKKPCLDQFGIPAQLSDHAMIKVSLEMNKQVDGVSEE